jgi:flagellar biosynthesis/type III secretory pathway protein FliH
LERQRRRAYLQYQQRYWDRIRRDQIRLQQARYYDNLYNDYRYYRGGQYFYTSQYGARMLQDAINNGYEEGFRAGQADRNDGWEFDYTSSYGYQDASFGYDAYYVDSSEYNHYFREGFRRGYEDGYYGQYRYGSYSNGKYAILGSIIGTILDIVRF